MAYSAEKKESCKNENETSQSFSSVSVLRFTDEVWYETAIGESSGRRVEESFAIGREIGAEILGSVDEVVVSRIEKGIAEDEEGDAIVR